METEKCDLETRLTMEMAGGVFLSQSSYNTLNKRLRRLHHLSGSEVVDLIKTEVLVPVRDLTWAPAFPPVPLVAGYGGRGQCLHLGLEEYKVEQNLNKRIKIHERNAGKPCPV